jgi:aspartate dehydrogenase
MTAGRPSLRVGLAGLGGVGLDVARRLIDGIDGLTLAAISVRDADKARRNLPQLGDLIALRTFEALADDCDVIVECLPPEHFRAIAISAIDQGRIFMPLSVAQLLDNWDLVARAKNKAPASWCRAARCSGSTRCAPPRKATSGR